MTATRKLWVFLIGLLLASFTVLLWVGGEIHRVMPPIPKAVLSDNGAVLYTRADIEQGRQVWQSIGGHQLGSIWGHGSYVAPDWSADWLHREAIEWLNITARSQTAHDYAELPADQQAGLRAQLQATIRTNTYDPKSDTITLTSERATAIATADARGRLIARNSNTGATTYCLSAGNSRNATVCPAPSGARTAR